MVFDELNKYLQYEFAERNHEIQLSVTRLKGESNARGLLNSSITLHNLSEFFFTEFCARADFIKNFIVGYAGKLDLKSCKDPITVAKTLFQHLSSAEQDQLTRAYDEAVSQIANALQSSFPMQIRDHMTQGMETHIQKNNIYVELEYKVCNEAKASGKELFFLTPNIQGVGMDLKELWKRVFST